MVREHSIKYFDVKPAFWDQSLKMNTLFRERQVESG